MKRPPQARRLHCHGCGRQYPNPRAGGAGLHCSDACEKKFGEEHEAAEKQLLAAGFRRKRKAGNAFTKDGVTVTGEQVRRHGMAMVLEAHRKAAGK